MGENKPGARRRPKPEHAGGRVRRIASVPAAILVAALTACAQPSEPMPALESGVAEPAAQFGSAATDAVAAAPAGEAAVDGVAGADLPPAPDGAADGGVATPPLAPTDGAAVVLTAPAAPMPPALPEIDSNPVRLLGMVEPDVRALLGIPVFVRTDGPARLWRYRGEACLLDLFLYRAASDDSPFRVRHVEARGEDQAPSPADACLEALLRARLHT